MEYREDNTQHIVRSTRLCRYHTYLMHCTLKLPLSYLEYATSPVKTQETAVKCKVSVQWI